MKSKNILYPGSIKYATGLRRKSLRIEQHFLQMQGLLGLRPQDIAAKAGIMGPGTKGLKRLTLSAQGRRIAVARKHLNLVWQDKDLLSQRVHNFLEISGGGRFSGSIRKQGIAGD